MSEAAATNETTQNVTPDVAQEIFDNKLILKRNRQGRKKGKNWR